MILLRFMWACFQAYKSNEPKYFAIVRYGVPTVACIVAKNRDAWKVADFAANFFGHIRGIQG